MKSKKEIEKKIKDIESEVSECNELANSMKLGVPDEVIKSMYGLGQYCAALVWVLNIEERG